MTMDLASRSILVAAALLATAPPMSAAAGQTPPPPGFRAIRNIQYVAGGDQAQVLDLYVPEAPPEKPLPLIVTVHGGGWSAGSKDGLLCYWLVGHGYAAASLEYRFSQKALFPAQIQDCQAAIRWLRANGLRYGIDVRRIGVAGHSAGGHLVALLGTAGGKRAFAPVGGNQRQSDRVQAVLDLCGPADFSTVVAQAAADRTKSGFSFNHGDPYSMLIGTRLGESPAREAAVSPVHYATRDNPPFLIVHGTADNLVPFAQSLELRDVLRRVRVDVTLQPLTNVGHGGPEYDQPAVRALISAFFDRHLRGARTRVDAIPTL